MSGWRRHIGQHWATVASVALHGAAVGIFLVQFTHPAPSLPADNEAPSMAVEVMLMPTPTPDVVNTAAPPPAPPPPEPEPEPEVIEEPPPLIQSVAEAPPAPPPPPPKVKKPDPEPPKPITKRVPPRPERPPPQPVAEAKPVEAPPAPPAPPVPAPPAKQMALAAPAGRAGPPPTYLTLIAAQLERNKVYPRMAQIRRQQGRVRLRFAIDRQGNVLRHKILASSGYAILDREVEALIKRVSPLPPMPPEMTQETLEMTVPIEFFLR